MRFEKFSTQERKIIALASIGGMFELYDFMIYGIFSVYFSHQFFPGTSAILSTIESYVIFVLGFLARPIGGLIFSYIGDEYGRKKVLMMTIILIGISSLGIGFLPTYNQIGILAPILLLFLRVFQGLAVGGELPSTYVYITESILHKRGSAFGVVAAGVNAGILLGLFINMGLNAMLTQSELMAYGWRFPFIFGGTLCFISYFIRKMLRETKAFTKIHDKPKFPLGYLFRNHLRQLIIGLAIATVIASFGIVINVFMPTYLYMMVKIKNPEMVGGSMVIMMMVNLMVILMTGKIINYIPLSRVLFYLLIISIVDTPLGYWLINSTESVMLGMVMLSALQGAFMVVAIPMLTYLFPVAVRLTGVALCYNIGLTIFGGLAPIVISSLIKLNYSVTFVPIIYLLATTGICAVGLAYAKKYSDQAI